MKHFCQRCLQIKHLNCTLLLILFSTIQLNPILFLPAPNLLSITQNKRMYQLSLWARNHVWQARLFIIVAYLLLNITGWLLGEQLAWNGIYLTQTHFYIGTALVLAGFFAYPSKKDKKNFKHFYRYQKSCDGLLASGTFVLIVCLSQPQSLPQTSLGFSAQASNYTTVYPSAEKKHSIFRKAANTAIKWLGVNETAQKKISNNWRQIKQEYKRSSTGGKIALLLLTILVALALLYLVAGWACTLSCNGSEAAATLVGIFGTGLVVFLSIVVIRRIFRKPKKESAPDNQSSNSVPL